MIRSDARPGAFIVRVVYNEEMFGDKMGVTDTDGDQTLELLAERRLQVCVCERSCICRDAPLCL